MSEPADPLVIDVDTGIDDAFALLYACAHDETQILGVSTVVGNVSACGRDAQHARRSRACGAGGYPGLAGRGGGDLDRGEGRERNPRRDRPRPCGPAPARRAAACAACGGFDHRRGALACRAPRSLRDGPLTNIALAVMREPELPRLVKRFVIMGGAYSDPGNVTPSAEFNIWHDPEAARIVFRAFGGVGGAPVIAIGLDVTRKTIIDERDVAAIASRIAGKPHGAKLTRFLEDASRFYFERMEKMLGKRIFTMHDPLAVAVALDPTLVETRRAAVDVETTGRLTTGATIVDWRGQWGRLANTEVAVAVDAERFRDLFFDAMARLADGAAGG